MFIDSLFIMLMVAAVFKGYSRGLIVAVFSFVTIIIGLAAALKLSAVVANWLGTTISVGKAWLPILSFALVMFAVVFLVKLWAGMVQRSANVVMMAWVNKLGGILLYAALYTTLLSVVLFFAAKIGLFTTSSVQASKMYPFIQPWAPKAMSAMGTVVPIFKDMFGQLETFFDAVAAKASQ
jgi:membrane protein required for colicin V production